MCFFKHDKITQLPFKLQFLKLTDKDIYVFSLFKTQ
jgi:hypothetical protein